jgi:membrane protein YdbS with pleckstrin-like domain
LVDDLPRAGMSAADVNAQRAAELKREARRMPMALMVLWTIWGAVTAVNVMVWFIVAATTGFDLYLWPVWLLVPGAALAAVTVGVQSIRQRRQEQ